MIVDHPRIKSCLSEGEKIEFIKDLADSYFLEQSDGAVEYVPYYSDRAFEIFFYLYCIDGIQFETKGGSEDLEDIMGAVSKHPDIKELYTKFISGGIRSCPILLSQIDDIKEQVKDIVEFKKQIIIHRENSLDKILQIIRDISPIAESLKNVDFSQIDWKVVEEIFLASLLRNGNSFESVEKKFRQRE